jgi:hypothetical protein
MAQVTADILLATWERGQARHPLDRALLLFALAAPEIELDELADRPLGQRNLALLRLRRELFGDRLDACVDCPGCSERLEFPLSASALGGPATAAGQASTFEVDGHGFRLPSTRDLARVADELEPQRAAARLLSALATTELAPALEASSEFLARFETALESADPCGDLALDLECPSCHREWTAPFDVATFVWDELERRAQHWLDDVHLLASAYGWSESQTLALSESRRRAYLERVLA